MTRYAKTVVALIPALLAALKVLSDGLGDGTVSNQEWIGTAIAFLGAAAVYAVPNRPPAGQLADPRMSEQDPPAQTVVAAHFDRPADRPATTTTYPADEEFDEGDYDGPPPTTRPTT